jgi:SH3-like domain-containing protein
MPLEVLSTVNQWVKVRDQAGDVVWIERSDLGAQRTVVTTTTASVKAAAQDSAANSFQVERGVVLEWLDPVANPQWLRVKHRDGSSGFVKAAEVWGY